MKAYTKKEIWSLIKHAPEEIQGALFSGATEEAIQNIKERHGIPPENPLLAKYVAHVLLGILNPANLEDALKKNMSLKPRTVQEITRELHRFIFSPVKSSIDSVYGYAPNQNSLSKDPRANSSVSKKSISNDAALKPPQKRGGSAKDPYREKVET